MDNEIYMDLLEKEVKRLRLKIKEMKLMQKPTVKEQKKPVLDPRGLTPEERQKTEKEIYEPELTEDEITYLDGVSKE